MRLQIIILAISFISTCTSPDKLTKVNNAEDILNKLIRQEKTPSVQYAIFSKDNIINRFQSGYSDIRNHKFVDEHTTFNAFSVTKTFTALAILQLVEAGHFDIDDNVIKYLPNFPYAPDITVRHLLSHTSGIPNPNPLSWIHLEDEHLDFDRDHFFDQIFKKYNKIKSSPNEKFSYSNLEYVLLGQVIERISNKSFEEYMREHIFNPLLLEPGELSFELTADGHKAKGYQRSKSFMNLILGFFIDKSKFMGEAEGKWKPFNNLYINGTHYGGLIGTPIALVKYIQELLKEECVLLSNKFKKLLFVENFTNDGKPTGMCLSWYKGTLNGNTYFCHAGGGGGYYCEIRIYPDIGIGSLIMFNRSGMKDERFLDKLDIHYLVENK